jgi:hypothetical protein
MKPDNRLDDQTPPDLSVNDGTIWPPAPGMISRRPPLRKPQAGHGTRQHNAVTPRNYGQARRLRISMLLGA